jgi:hypothetical protein
VTSLYLGVKDRLPNLLNVLRWTPTNIIEAAESNTAFVLSDIATARRDRLTGRSPIPAAIAAALVSIVMLARDTAN